MVTGLGPLPSTLGLRFESCGQVAMVTYKHGRGPATRALPGIWLQLINGFLNGAK